MLIKICGLTDVYNATATAQAGADIIGLVFAESRRRVSLRQAVEIASSLKRLTPTPAIAGVFVNESVQVVNRMINLCGLDVVQLSGGESWEYCAQINRPVIKVIHVSSGSKPVEIIKQIMFGYRALKRRCLCMLDAGYDGKYGGTGCALSSELAASVSAAVPVMIAGGLSPDTVGEIIRIVKPLGVDVSSGVETGGLKDMKKIKTFIQAVRAEQSELPVKISDIFNFL